MATKLIMQCILVCVAAIIAVNTQITNAEVVIASNKLVMLCKTLNNCVDDTNSAISLNYFYSGPNGNGQEFSLKNGTSLYNNDRFTIEVTVHKSVYLYLFYVDSSGSIKELLYQSDKSNYVIAGQSFMLPGSLLWPAFDLDTIPGTETIYAIVSLHRRDDLVKIRSEENLRGLIIMCECGDPCRQPFIIRHLYRN